MARFVFREHWVGAHLTPLRAWDKQAALAIQFAAKLIESFIIGSLTTMVFTFVRMEATMPQGIPLAAFFASHEYKSPSFIWSNDIFAMLQGQFSSVWKKGFFIVFSLTCCALAVLVAPAIATILMPIQDWYKLGGSWAWIDVSIQEMYPSMLTANNTLHGEICHVTGDLRCPSAGWESLEQLASFFPGQRKLEVDKPLYTRPPGLWPLPTTESVLLASLTVREPVENPEMQWEDSRMMLPPRATGAGLVKITALWETAMTRMGQENERNYRGSDSRYTTYSEVASITTRCLARNDNRPLQFPDVRNPQTLYSPMIIEDVDTEDLLKSMNGSIPELFFFDINPEGDLAANASIGSVVSLPVERNEPALYGCITNAQWTAAQIHVFQYYHVKTQEWFEKSDWGSNRMITIRTSYANLSNPIVEKTNTTVFQRLATTAGLASLENRGPDWTPCHIETLINGMLINAMARTAPNAHLITTLKDENGAWWRHFFPRSRLFERQDAAVDEAAFAVEEADQSRFASFYFRAEMQGFAYSNQDNTVRNLVFGLFVYCGIAGLFVLWSVGRGITSSSWDSIPELLALAMRSPPPGDFTMPTSVLEDTKALSHRYGIMAEKEALFLRPIDDHERIPRDKRVKPNKLYR
ncbi:hypothetical protein CGCF415_v009689 [Colletotrichum fructicola]|nr:hypothetical protein CGCFRS4_v007497 [Colletotrichum fructicola]KAF4901561.1 hypothetical protein CGCF415_v009689 [Colletotrichum fructicola]